MRFLTSRPHRIPMLLVLSALAIASLACNAAGVSQIGGPPPSPALEVSPDDLQSFNNKWRELNLATPDGPFSLTFTEGEITSAVQSAIAEAEAETGQALPIEDVTVSVREGAIDVYGQAQIDPLTVNGMISVVPTLSDSGRIELEVIDVQFGAIELSEDLLDEVVESVEHSINQPLQASPSRITLDTITMTDGELTVSGTINP